MNSLLLLPEAVHRNHTHWCSCLSPTGLLHYIPGTPHHAELHTHMHVISWKGGSGGNCIHRFTTLTVPRQIPRTRHTDGGIGESVRPAGVIVEHPVAHGAWRSKENVFGCFFHPLVQESKQKIVLIA